MSKAEGAVAWAVAIANNPAHGYDQASRWGPDYDCSSLVISAWESVGVTVREAGASYTGNMRGAFLACGFKDVTQRVNLATGSGMQPGDVLLNYAAHTAMVTGSGRIVAARINERNTTTGGAPGDQTGREITQQNYYNFPWDCVLRYEEAGESSAQNDADPVDSPATPQNDSAPELPTASLPVVRYGATGETVRAVQILLIGRGYRCGPYGSDGEFGDNTYGAVLRYQTVKGLTPDGVIGAKTWAALLGVTV